MAITALHFDQKSYSGVLDIIERLAALERRRPHEAAKLLIEDYGKQRIAELEKEHSQQPSSVDG